MNTRCPLCEKDLLEGAELGQGAATRYTCKGCGTFSLEGRLGASKVLDSGSSYTGSVKPDERLRLRAAVRLATDRGQELCLDDERMRVVIGDTPAPHPADQPDRLLLEVGRRCRWGEPAPAEHGEAWAARTFISSWQKLREMIRMAGQVQIHSPVDDAAAVVLGVASAEAWRTLKSLERAHGAESQAFVAMWFHSDMDIAWTDGFKPALEACGFTPCRIDKHPHNNKIEDEIIAQIRKSRIVVADFTGSRGAVYYEAGFAHGLGREVIHCCGSKDAFRAFVADTAPHMTAHCEGKPTTWFDQVAFDSSHQNFILWNDPADLQKKLVERIEALGWSITKG